MEEKNEFEKGEYPSQPIGQWPSDQPGIDNTAFVQPNGGTVIRLNQPGQESYERTLQQHDPKLMPSVACPIFAFICYMPVGIAVLIYYLRAKKLSEGNCF